MKIEISIPEIANFIKSYFDISVDIKYVDTNKIDVNYMITLGIHIKEVQDYSVLLGYELNWAANLLAKSGKLMMGKNLDKDVLCWNTSKKEILLNLRYIDAMKDFLRIYKIARFEIINDMLVLELKN